MRSKPLLFVLLLAACGGGSTGSSAHLPHDPFLDFKLDASGAWQAKPLRDALDQVSNNGLGYTGEIDRFELVVPADGRLVVSLTWDGDSDLDFILASDPQAENRLLESSGIDFDAEYESLPVIAGQTIYVIVAGWRGEPGEYLLESTVYPAGAPEFALETMPDFDALIPNNLPLVFTFNVDLDPDQDLAGRVALLDGGVPVDGAWCIDGRELRFHPRLPQFPGDAGGLPAGEQVQLAFHRAARGVRAVTGEYLIDATTVSFPAGPPRLEDPAAIPRVLNAPSQGGPLVGALAFTLSMPINPLTLFPVLTEERADGSSRRIAFSFVLSQVEPCHGNPRVQLSLELEEALTPGTTLRVVLPGNATALGAPAGAPGLAGPAPTPAGDGFTSTYAID